MEWDGSDPVQREEIARIGIKLTDRLMNRIERNPIYNILRDDFRSMAMLRIATRIEKIKGIKNLDAYLTNIIFHAFIDQFRYLKHPRKRRLKIGNDIPFDLVSPNDPGPEEMAILAETWKRSKLKPETARPARIKPHIKQDEASMIMALIEANKEKSLRAIGAIITEKTGHTFGSGRVHDFRKRWEARLCTTQTDETRSPDLVSA